MVAVASSPTGVEHGSDTPDCVGDTPGRRGNWHGTVIADGGRRTVPTIGVVQTVRSPPH
jgi:hypothetical protein